MVEELVYAKTSDGITNAGEIVAPAANTTSPIAVIWIHGSQLNFYEPGYVKICRELAARGFTTLTANTRMHDLGTVAVFRGDTRIRGGVYWGRNSEQTRDLAAWVDFMIGRGFKGVLLVGHSAGTTAVQTYESLTQDPRVVGLVIASGRVRPGADPSPERVTEAKKLVDAGLAEALLPNADRPTSFVSAATFLDLANMGRQLRDFYGVQAPDGAPVTRVRCPLLAWFGTNESDIGTEADLDLLKATLKRLPNGPSRVETTMIQNADHMYQGQERQVAETIAKWAGTLVPR
jgi:pimeloyl-ACP methyl ester carboxylesterase